MNLADGTVQLLRQAATEILALDVRHPTRVGVDGFCAAGKTTIANELGALLSASSTPVIRVSTDDFQNPPEIRWQLGEMSPEGFYRHSVDHQALDRELLAPLGTGGSGLYRTSTYDIHALRPNLSTQFEVPQDAVLVLDGLFLHTKRIDKALDYTIFVDAPLEVCLIRALARNQEGRADPAEIEALYRTRYIPGFALYVSECNPREAASAAIRNV